MEAARIVAISVGVIIAILLAFCSSALSASDSKKQKERRMAEHRMNARLLKLDI